MAARVRQTNRAVKSRITASQANRAEHFRLLLSDAKYHGLRGQEAASFEAFVAGMSQVELTNLSRQYRAPLEVYYDSQGVTAMIASDVMRRVKHLIRQQAANVSAAKINQEIFKEDTRRDTSSTLAKVTEAYFTYRNSYAAASERGLEEIGDIPRQRMADEIERYRQLYDRAKTKEGRDLILRAARGDDVAVTHKRFQELYGIGRKGREKYRDLLPTTK